MATLKAGAHLVYAQTINGNTITCEGVVWSAGPTASTYWVLPNHGRRKAVCVKMPTHAQRERGAKPFVVDAGDSPAQRTALLERVQRIGKAGIVFGAADPAQLTLTGEQAVSYHVDESCAALAGKARTMRYGRPDTLPGYRATDVLLGKRQPDIQLCGSCIYLDGAA